MTSSPPSRCPRPAPAWARLTDPGLNWLDGDEQGQRVHRLGIDYQAVRTHFFDGYFADTAGAGLRQVVILAAGLDCRAYRLDWPAGTTVYEVDQPRVLEYKTGILESHGAVPAATRRTVAVDLRYDWPAALTAAGFDRTQPTAWLAEGLLPYLPSDAQDWLFEKFTRAQRTGQPGRLFRMNSSSNTSRWQRMRDRLGLDVNVQALTFHEPDRSDVAEWLAGHGWQVTLVDNREEMARFGRPVPEHLTDYAVHSMLLRACLGGARN